MGGEHIGIGIIGTGFGAKVQLPGFALLPSARVMGIASSDGARAASLAREHALPVAPSSWRELLEHPDVHLVSVAVRPALQEEVVRSALDAGKHVLCEKPFTLGALQAERLLLEARRAGVVHAVDLEFRALRTLQALRERLAGGLDGALRSIRFEWNVGTWADPSLPWRWQCDRSECGGVLSAIGVHLFDMAEWICGPAESVKAALRTAIRERPGSDGKLLAVTAEDTADLELRMRSGLTVWIATSNVDPSGAGLVITAECERATLTLDGGTQRYGSALCLQRGDEVLLREEPVAGDPRVGLFAAAVSPLVAAIAHGTTYEGPSFHEGVRIQRIREGAIRSSQTADWVDIPEPEAIE